MVKALFFIPCYSFISPPHCYVCLADGMMALPSGFSPFAEFVDESQQWRWIGKKDKLLKFLADAVPYIQNDSVH